MKTPVQCLIAALAWACLDGGTRLLGDGASFTYQGRLTSSNTPANGVFDFAFSAYDAVRAGNQVAGPVTNIAVVVSNGIFTTIVDLGANVFSGEERWLEIAVRANDGGEFTTLTPRQHITAVPYAIHARSVNSAGIDGTISGGMLAPGAAAANLAASGATILSAEADTTNLLSAGYTRVGGPLDLSWQECSLDLAPSPRQGHTAVWTGREMMIWGGLGDSFLNTGARLDPSGGRWRVMSIMNAPRARQSHTAVWTGSEMLIWGGQVSSEFDPVPYTDDGGRYDPTTDAWQSIAMTNAPVARRGHAAVWTGTGMIVWGGEGNNGLYRCDGGHYIPAVDSWLPTATNSAPVARIRHTAIWTGTEMIVWGGESSPNEYLGDGGRYNPQMDAWSAVSTNGAPAPRSRHSAIWTGTEMIIWGGDAGSRVFNDGARYNPTTGAWLPISTNRAPAGRFLHTAIWTGAEMIVWGGGDNKRQFNDGGRYNPARDCWEPVTTLHAPRPRLLHTAVWAGTEMVVFGGTATGVTAFGDAYTFTPARVLYLYLKP